MEIKVMVPYRMGPRRISQTQTRTLDVASEPKLQNITSDWPVHAYLDDLPAVIIMIIITRPIIAGSSERREMCSPLSNPL